MIQLTLTFTSIEAARQALLDIPESALVPAAPRAAVTVTAGDKPEQPKKVEAKKPEAAKTDAPADTPSTVEASAAPETKAAPSVPSVDYPTLQKAVFALAGKSREAAAEVAGKFGVKTFKELPEAQWADALAAVNTKLAEVA